MGIKIRNAALKLFSIILCWALLVVPCTYLILKDFNASVGVNTTVTTPVIIPSAPVSGTEAAGSIDASNDLPTQDLYENSDIIISNPADKTLSSLKPTDIEAAAGKAPELFKPPVVVVPEEPKEPENTDKEDDKDTSGTVTAPESGNINDNNGSAGFYGDHALLVQPDGSNFIYYDQTWDAYASHPYGSKTIGGYGCGPTSMAMVVSNLTNTIITPDDMGDWSASHGYFVNGRGTAYGLFPAVSAMYGIDCETISSSDKQAVVSALKEGKLLLTVVGRGDFTIGRHFLLIRGITEDGKLLLADSGKYENCLTEWDYDRVVRQISGGQFWVFS